MNILIMVAEWFYDTFKAKKKRLYGVIDSYDSTLDIYFIKDSSGQFYGYSKNQLDYDITDFKVVSLIKTGVEVCFYANARKIVFNTSINENKYDLIEGELDYALFNESEGNYDASFFSIINGKKVFFKFDLSLLSPRSKNINKAKEGSLVYALYSKEQRKLISVCL